MNCTTNNKP